MKSILTLAITFFTLVVNAQEIKFETEVIDYGKITQNSNGKRVFTFTNVGNNSLNLRKVVATCEDIKLNFSKENILAGESGKIEVSYDTKRLGSFSKVITVYSNAKNGERKQLKIVGRTFK